MDVETRRHSNGHMGLTHRFLLDATSGEQWGYKATDPSPSKANDDAQIIFLPVCCFGNGLFTKKEQVNIFHSVLFRDIEQE